MEKMVNDEWNCRAKMFSIHFFQYIFNKKYNKYTTVFNLRGILIRRKRNVHGFICRHSPYKIKKQTNYRYMKTILPALVWVLHHSFLKYVSIYETLMYWGEDDKSNNGDSVRTYRFANNFKGLEKVWRLYNAFTRNSIIKTAVLKCNDPTAEIVGR